MSIALGALVSVVLLGTFGSYSPAPPPKKNCVIKPNPEPGLLQKAARRHGLRIPQDLAVVGFDGIPASKFVTPQLSTVYQPMAEKGRLAVSRLFKEKGPLPIKVPTKLVVRQSSDPAILGADEEREIDVH
jgi:Periplasmic binding protein-like domain